MRVRQLKLQNFRGARRGTVEFQGDSLLVGGNGAGKSTICEALDLVLGPERLYRRPPIDEHDFWGSEYFDKNKTPVEIRIELVLTDLSEPAQRRFASHLRKWNPESERFADDLGQEDEPLDDATLADLPWALPVEFIGRYNLEDDEFQGATFFSHPIRAGREEDFGGGRRSFTREDKRFCGFLYLRPNRTGRRALSFERGSLLDTILRLEVDSQLDLWESLRASLQGVTIENESELASLVFGVRDRLAEFINLSIDPDALSVRASDLTRENIRETLRLFLRTGPQAASVPFDRLSTGTLNLIVFGLLTYIAELKADQSTIFALEEPEIAIPPHAQRRLIHFAQRNMGQLIVTSHSPYVIEQFEPEQILVLSTDDQAVTAGRPINLPSDFKAKRYRENRRQFAEAVLAAGVLVVEGSTEASVLPVVADVMERDASEDFIHPDLLGLTILDANNDVSVPLYAPLFKVMGKRVYGSHDIPTKPFKDELVEKSKSFDIYLKINHMGIEDLLLEELGDDTKLRFMLKAQDFPDYPDVGKVSATSSPTDVDKLLRSVLKSRKGAHYGYAAALVSECHSVADLPQSYVDLLRQIQGDLRSTGGDFGLVVAQDAPDDPADDNAASSLQDASESPNV